MKLSEELLNVIRMERFGENSDERLDTFLFCQAFEMRMDPQHSRALALAARIVQAALEEPSK